MLIEIDDSIVTEASSCDANALFVLQMLATSQRKGFHIVWAVRRVLKKIVRLTELSSLDIATYSAILNKYSTISSEYKKIGFNALVTYSVPTHQDMAYIVINPKEVPDFNLESKTNLLTENLLDATFFEYVANYKKTKSGISQHITIECDKEPGGGDTTAQKYEDFAVKREYFCLSVLDGDKKHPTASPGGTCSKVIKTHRRLQPFNCLYYYTDQLLEVENLIPQDLYLKDSNYQHAQIVSTPLSFDMSFFDIKDGLKYKKLSDQATRDYWRTVLKGYADLLECIDLAELVRNACANSEEYSKSCGEDKIIDGFGSKLFDRILNTKAVELEAVTDTDLTASQISEWDKIGGLVLQWCCGTKLHKNPLFVA